ncbi:hypothetical protein B0H16DRAFT_1329762 [Mycena metata]|uniref:FAR1 domain-containing protein n=1 Tax=Mycena metata TaxID=1033252 RepID=A0AAD7MS68_9AGAR|nr:hypothetical protein B0H16DRAFT_1329762 [Mycena metata]
MTTYYGLPEFERQLRYVCSRGGTGGVKPYTKRHPEWHCKLPNKRTGCECVLLVKQYPGVTTVLGNYRDEHNHPLGNANLPFIQIPKETREYIAGLLRLKTSPDHIVSALYTTGIVSAPPTPPRSVDRDLDDQFFIQLRDIRRIQKEIEAESVQLYPDDGVSTLRWVENLRAKGHLLGFKSKSDPPPPGSGVPPDVFLLMIQTGWQQRMFEKHGSALVCVDATHNTTMYENLNLTTLIVRDRWAHGT